MADDPAYDARRAAIASVGAAHRPGDPIPDVEYVPEEDDVWRTVSAELGALHARMFSLRDAGRTGEACAAIQPYLDAIHPTWQLDHDEALARTTWMEHGRALERELGCRR